MVVFSDVDTRAAKFNGKPRYPRPLKSDVYVRALEVTAPGVVFDRPHARTEWPKSGDIALVNHLLRVVIGCLVTGGQVPQRDAIASIPMRQEPVAATNDLVASERLSLIELGLVKQPSYLALALTARKSHVLHLHL
jgi:hypothetical protein